LSSRTDGVARECGQNAEKTRKRPRLLWQLPCKRSCRRVSPDWMLDGRECGLRKGAAQNWSRPVNLKHALLPAVALIALSLTAVPADAQQRRGNGNRGGGERTEPRASASQQRATPRQSEPRSGVQQQQSYAQEPRPGGQRAVQRQTQPRTYAQQPQGRSYAQAPRSGGQQGQAYAQQRSYAQAPRSGGQQGQAYAQQRSYAQAPRSGGQQLRSYDNNRAYAGRAPYSGYGSGYGYSGDAGRRGYVAPRGGYGYGYASRYGYGYGYRPYYYPRAYYSFRPRLSLGFGLWIGFPTAYPYYSYGYANPAYGYPLSRFGLAAGTAYGGISFEVDPYDAAIFIDGEYAGIVGDFGPNAQPLTLRSGTYRVEIQADGYAPVMFDVNVMPGQVIPYRGAMRPY